MRPGTIVLVEDYDGIREGMSEVLRLRGHPVYAFERSDPALAHVEATPPPALFIIDLVLADGIDGWALIRKLRERPALAHVPILAMSGAYISSEQIRESGATAFLRKPFEFEELFAAIHGLIPPADP